MGISTVSTLEMDGTLSLSGTASQAITHTGTIANTNDFLTVSPTNGNTKIESVTFAGQAISTVTTLDMSGALDMGGTLTLKNSGAQTIDHNHNSLLTIQSNGNTKIESVTFAGEAISTVSTLEMDGTLSLSGTASQAITHTGTTANTNDFLTVSSTNGNVKIEAVTFAGQAISTVTTLDMSGALDMGGTLTLKNSGAQTINHNHNSLLIIQSDGN